MGRKGATREDTMRFLLPAALVISLAAPATARAPEAPAKPAAPLGAGVVYTGNEDGRTISAVDLKTGRTHSVSVPVMPHNVQISRTGRWLYAVGMAGDAGMMHAQGHEPKTGDMPMKPGRLLVLDARRPDLRTVADIPIGPHPAHVVADAAERRAYVSDGERNAVLVVELSRRRVIASIPTGAFPHGLRLSPDGRTLFVANVNDNTVSAISTASLKETARIPVGKAPVQVAVSPDGRRLYVSLRDEDSVAVVDTARRTVLKRIPVGRGPIQVYVTSNGKTLLVANEGTAENPDRTVSLIDTATHGVVKTLTTGRGAHGVAASADSWRGFVTNSMENTMTVVDVPGRRVLRSFPVGKGPNGITYQPPRR